MRKLSHRIIFSAADTICGTVERYQGLSRSTAKNVQPALVPAILFKGKAGVPAVFWTSFDVWLWQGCYALANCAVTWIMFDVMMLVLVVGCFALAAAYASLCDRLLTRTGKDLPS